MQPYCKNMLAALRTYKHFLAAFLLAVYSFIAAPAQLWHHHKGMPRCEKKIVVTNTSLDSISQGVDFPSDNNCPTCSHKYSSYVDDSIAPFDTIITYRQIKKGEYVLTLITASSTLLPNKDPPAIS